MIGRLPLMHGGGVTWDEWAVFVGFALVLGLITHWIDYRRGTLGRSAGEHPGGQHQDEDNERAQADERGETRLNEVSHRVGARRNLALKGLPEQ